MTKKQTSRIDLRQVIEDACQDKIRTYKKGKRFAFTFSAAGSHLDLARSRHRSVVNAAIAAALARLAFGQYSDRKADAWAKANG